MAGNDDEAAPDRLEEFLAGQLTPSPAPGAVVADLIKAGILDPPALRLPGAGSTWDRFRALYRLARHDVALARLAEGHADAVAILGEAGREAPEGASLGVWAAGPPEQLLALPVAAGGHDGNGEPGSGYRLRGTRRWCSGAGTLSHALVTAVVPSSGLQPAPSLFLVPVHPDEVESVHVDSSSWPAVGMARTDTFDVTFEDLYLPPEALVGAPGWYVERLGFWRGGAGVAACWWGGARGVADALFQRAGPGAPPLLLAAAGDVAGHLWSMECSLRACAEAFDRNGTAAAGAGTAAAGAGTAAAEAHIAQLTRLVVERAAVEVLRLVGDATGAEPLSHDAGHATRVADLTVYLRQHHGSRDAAALGEELAKAGWRL